MPIYPAIKPECGNHLYGGGSAGKVMNDWKSRRLSAGESAMVGQVFGGQVEIDRVRIRREKFAFFQPKNVTMAPNGEIWLHPQGILAKSEASADFSKADLPLRCHFIHEMTHVWQKQSGVDLVLEKIVIAMFFGPLGGYDYVLEEGKDFASYNIEQQACMVADAYSASEGSKALFLDRFLPF